MKLTLTSNLAVVVRHNTPASIEHTACSRKSPSTAVPPIAGRNLNDHLEHYDPPNPGSIQEAL
jgi:hypothetical protein